MKKIFLLSIIVLVNIVSQGQTYPKILEEVFIRPSLTLGYTFGAGVTYGFDLYVGFQSFTQGKTDYYYGSSITYYWVNQTHFRHKILTLNMMLETDNYSLNVGLGRVRYVYGVENRNKTVALGYTFDLNVGTFTDYTPWFGYKKFVFNQSKWPWFNRPYSSFYTFFRQPRFMPKTLFED